MKPTMTLKQFPTAATMLAAMAFGVLVVLMTPPEWSPTVGQELAAVAFVIFVLLLWPRFRRALIRRKVRRVRGARRLSKIYRRSRRHGTQPSFPASAR